MDVDSPELFWVFLHSIFQFFLLAWPAIAILFALALIRMGFNAYQSARLSKSGIADLDNLTGEDFERYLETFFRKLGYQVRRTPYRGDYGADLILRRDAEEIVVQAKRHNRTVGVKAVQEAVAAKDYYHCAKAMVVTNNNFSPQAKALAKANQVELWDRNQLTKRLLALHEQTSPPAHLPPAPTTSPSVGRTPPPATTDSTATCAHCGKPLTDKVRDYCLTHPDIFGGKLYCFDHQRQVSRTER